MYDSVRSSAAGSHDVTIQEVQREGAGVPYVLTWLLRAPPQRPSIRNGRFPKTILDPEGEETLSGVTVGLPMVRHRRERYLISSTSQLSNPAGCRILYPCFAGMVMSWVCDLIYICPFILVSCSRSGIRTVQCETSNRRLPKIA